jgi:hypothetical protein
MKYKVTTLFLGLCMVIAHAQTTGLDSIKAMYDNLPGYLYTSQVLHNRSPLYNWSFTNDSNMVWQVDSNYTANPYLFPGDIPAPLIRKNQFAMLYNDMWHSSTNPQLLADAETYRTRDSIARYNVEVPIAAMHLNFHRMLPDAVENGLLWFDTVSEKYTVLPDTLWIDKPNGIYQYYSNPDSLAELAFEENESFVGALTTAVLYKAGSQFNVTFNLAASLFVSNQTAQRTYLEMDFANGQGFLPILMDVPITVSYNTTNNWESNERILRLRLHYGQKVVETRMPLVIVPNVQPADTVFYASNLPEQCNMSTNGFTPDQGKISLRYGNPNKKLLKPVLVTEGFESSLQDYGVIHFEGIMSGYIYDENGDRYFDHAELLRNAFDTLTALGYDIVYIDHKNPRDYIQANSYNFIKMIQWVNNELAKNNSNEKLVVVGASMGGC